MLRRALSTLFLWTEAWLDRVFGPSWNPLYQLGALGFFYYWIVVVSGIYLYIFFDTGTTEAYESVEYLTYDQWYLGGILRSFHRYASDGMVLMMAVHILREYALGHFKGPRWFTWITGIPVAGFVIVAGITGYWLVWDILAQYIALITAEWFDWLGIFGESIARNFLTPNSLDDRFFTLLMFIHIVVPLLLLLVLWIHLQRITKPKINPNRGLAVGTFVMLIALSLIEPALSHAPANLSTVPIELKLDWYYLAIYPFMEETSYASAWGLVVVLTLILGILPWLPPRGRAEPAVVHLESCNGCGRCANDCPYESILMRPRSDGLPFEQEAVVNSSLCTACGICAGSCPTSTPFRRRTAMLPGIDLPQATLADLRDELNQAALDFKPGPRILVLGCRDSLPSESASGEGAIALCQPCVAGIPPSFIDYALTRGIADGVVISMCREGTCEYRFGDRWMRKRLTGQRDPYLRKRIPRERIAVVQACRTDGRKVRDTVRDLSTKLKQGTETDGEPRVAETGKTESVNRHG